RDWKHVKADELQSALDEYLLVDRCSPFKLDVPPLMRFTLLAPAEGDYIFVWTLHHGLLDGRSRVLVLKEVALLYETFRRKETLQLPEPPSYTDYLRWHYSQDHSQAEGYWRRLLGSFSSPVSLAFPAETSRPSERERHAYQVVDLSPAC